MKIILNVAFHNKYSSKVKKEQAGDNVKDKFEYFFNCFVLFGNTKQH